jgi:hypothetical protein
MKVNQIRLVQISSFVEKTDSVSCSCVHPGYQKWRRGSVRCLIGEHKNLRRLWGEHVFVFTHTNILYIDLPFWTNFLLCTWSDISKIIICVSQPFDLGLSSCNCDLLWSIFSVQIVVLIFFSGVGHQHYFIPLSQRLLWQTSGHLFSLNFRLSYRQNSLLL